MIVVKNIMIEHDKSCKSFKCGNVISNLEVLRVNLQFKSCKEVCEYWRLYAKFRKIPLIKVTFNMIGDCLLK